MTPEREHAARICDAALDRPAGERDAFVSGACAGDERLRREVELLLAALAGETLRDGAPLLGRTVGPYLIQARLGVGGMGEVYKARDTKLGRDVAIKILPRLFASDVDRLARFEREARMLASLNHPHIGAIYGLDAIDGTPALVLELVDGDTLAERIAKRPIAPRRRVGNREADCRRS